MIDMSRNAVMNVDTIKFVLRKMALMGQNSFMLYTEDTYEVPERKYFGYMRGRYTEAELKELDAYAQLLGIELIPCIQLLGHLATALRWSDAAPYKDTANVLLVGEDKTYEFIDDLLKTIARCFKTKKIHIGMDETNDLGRGKSLNKNGYIPSEQLYFKHLEILSEKLKAYGFHPMMWSDMFFRLAGKDIPGFTDYDRRTVITSDMREKTRGIQQVFWDYYQPDEAFYAENIEKHYLLCDRPIFAGGIWFWSSFCPFFSESLRNTIPALRACKKGGIKDTIATVWHEGSESNSILSIAALAWYADFDYHGDHDIESVKRCFHNATGLNYDDFMLNELPDHPTPNAGCATRALVYNDPLIGLADYHIEGLDCSSYYRDTTNKLAAVKDEQGMFAEAFDTSAKLSDLLEYKANFGVRLKKAYDTKDNAALKSYVNECDIIIEKVVSLITTHRKAWLKYNKPFGWEVHDIRYGGIIARLHTTKMRINAYLGGEIDTIEELEATRLPINAKEFGTHSLSGAAFYWERYSTFATANILS